VHSNQSFLVRLGMERDRSVQIRVSESVYIYYVGNTEHNIPSDFTKQSAISNIVPLDILYKFQN